MCPPAHGEAVEGRYARPLGDEVLQTRFVRRVGLREADPLVTLNGLVDQRLLLDLLEVCLAGETNGMWLMDLPPSPVSEEGGPCYTADATRVFLRELNGMVSILFEGTAYSGGEPDEERWHVQMSHAHVQSRRTADLGEASAELRRGLPEAAVMGAPLERVLTWWREAPAGLSP